MKKSLSILLGSLLVLSLSTSLVAAANAVTLGQEPAIQALDSNANTNDGYCGYGRGRGKGQGGYCRGNGGCYNNGNNGGK